MTNAQTYHIPALLNDTIEGLNIHPDGTYVDVTLGGGGHSRAIMERLTGTGRLLSFDQDMDAFTNEQQYGEHSLHLNPRWQFVHGNFRYLDNFLDYYGIHAIDGLLADLGVSFHHFDQAERGFSFRFSGPLDMRMNQQGGITATDIVNSYSEQQLAQLLYLYGEMKNARQVAHVLCRERQNKIISRTEQLVEILTPLCGRDKEKKDLARLFQALRIEVNDELGALREMLSVAKKLLRPGGRIAILTYHSLEDRIVKNFLRSGNIEGIIEKDFYGNILTPFRVIEKGLTADAKEVQQNPRARSAKLRVAEKI
ncbi:MAG: 16S rRNA (cytosine(1402)-N(4))-methyltransferase RsmH [Bacteroidales bacterium]|nr:16S rRNA (cytosine(1402)-N(4))-methyltransferase RsmH [Candidatus Colicola coprequi]MBQ0137339.1 16S rRNA (cytosine(1402)-N(4))-methyltransferase RsmH [Bacteroidales bacterium]